MVAGHLLINLRHDPRKLSNKKGQRMILVCIRSKTIAKYLFRKNPLVNMTTSYLKHGNNPSSYVHRGHDFT